MKKQFKRLSVIMLAGAMVLGMNASVMAAVTIRDAAVTSSDTTLTIKKEIAYFNPTETTINYPAVTYTYSVAPVTVNDSGSFTVTDTSNKSAVVKPGITDGVVMDSDASATFSASSVAAKSTGTIVSDTFGVKVDLSKFTTAGIYRYALKETAPANLKNLGYERATSTDTVGTRYLDVYINNEDNGLKVAGYVLFYASSPNINITSEDQTFKTEGFVHEDSDNDYSDDTFIDKYKTYNIEVLKTVTGTLGDKSHAFPIMAAVAAGAGDSTVTLPVSITNTSTKSSCTNNGISLVNGAATSAEIAKIVNGDKVLITGIPVGSRVTIQEKNDTSDSYTVTTSGFDTDIATASTLNAGAESDSTTSVMTNSVEKKEVTFTNNLESPSPTGVILRFAPYLLITAFAIALLVMSGKRRKKV